MDFCCSLMKMMMMMMMWLWMCCGRFCGVMGMMLNEYCE